jgi:hypothetical protein
MNVKSENMSSVVRRVVCIMAINVVLIIGWRTASAQPAITGPVCTVTGTTYQYLISGTWNDSSTMQVCVSGGTIVSQDSTVTSCTPTGAAPLASVLVSFVSSGTASIVITTSQGNSTLNVNVAIPLTPGTIDSAVKVQLIGYQTVPAFITCSMDMGGSCSPVYSYQWQQSPDQSSWTNMPGATGANLSIDSALTQSAYYRRAVTDTTSGTIGYSDVAAVLVAGSMAVNESSKAIPNSTATRKQREVAGDNIFILLNALKPCFVI